ncbi:hypothetical protein HIM_08466 [Hirsutella minnesotensis 3608]|uniref:DUF7721 domain-containing protein n=1 Tax=Hirsutella minnesotensis 3608 TaxID=1043627 RepID=A0A0F7ZH85_9HYPO|nr:hypothetical protein HIM_08466 [Hirsutella minnesotensis 3608]
MDKLVSAGMEFLSNQSQNTGHGGGQSYTSGEDGPENVGQKASNLAGSSGDPSFFSSIVANIGQRKEQLANEDIDEDEAERNHAEAYHQDKHGDDNSLAAAAAMQAFKKFTGGGGDSEQGQGGGQGDFLAMAMSEASKLFDSKDADGKLLGGASKDSTVQKAGEMAMKLYFKNQAKQQGGVMGMAAQFMG